MYLWYWYVQRNPAKVQKIQSNTGSHDEEEKGIVLTAALRKRKLVEKYITGDPVPKGRCFVAMLHFALSVLRSKCMRRQGQEHIYCWLLPKFANNGAEEQVAPNYSIEEVASDVGETEKAVQGRPVNTAASKKSTKEIINLFFSNHTKLTSEQQQRMRDYSYFVRRQIISGRLLPAEKEARLDQIGFFEVYPTCRYSKQEDDQWLEERLFWRDCWKVCVGLKQNVLYRECF